jgi:hypothetical protein
VKVVFSITVRKNRGGMESTWTFAIAMYCVMSCVEIHLKRSYTQHEVNCIPLTCDSNGRLKHER